jgi:hypothetical protein
MTATKVLVALSMLAIAAPAIAEARRLPTRAERMAIMRQVDRQAFYETYGRECVAFALRVSTVDSRWAAVTVQRTKRSCNVQGDVESFHRGSAGWRRHQLGNGGGCNMPAAVRDDLRLACY